MEKIGKKDKLSKYIIQAQEVYIIHKYSKLSGSAMNYISLYNKKKILALRDNAREFKAICMSF